MTILAVATGSAPPDAFLEDLSQLFTTGQRLAYAMLRSEDEAEDAVQEAALKAWRARERFRPGAALRPWFLTIVANECRQRRRSHWWSVNNMSDVPRWEDTRPDERVTGADLRAALRRISIDHRLVVVLRYYLDLPFEEIGKIVGCSPQAAKSRTHRALQQLRLEVPRQETDD